MASMVAVKPAAIFHAGSATQGPTTGPEPATRLLCCSQSRDCRPQEGLPEKARGDARPIFSRLPPAPKGQAARVRAPVPGDKASRTGYSRAPVKASGP